MDAAIIQHVGPLADTDAERLYEQARVLVDGGEAPRALVSALVELVQNLRLHGGAEGSVAVRRVGETWELETRNAVPEEDAQRVLMLVSAANEHSPSTLRKAMRERRRQALPPGARGAGLGLLQLRRMAAGPISARTCPDPSTGPKSMLVIAVRVTHNQSMADLELAPSMMTPRVHLPAKGGEAWISGACYPENAFAFFQPIFDWLGAFRAEGARAIELNVKLDYFNTSSSKCLLDLFAMLQEAKAEGLDAKVRWHYCEDDLDMRDSGEEFAEDLAVPFELVAY